MLERFDPKRVAGSPSWPVRKSQRNEVLAAIQETGLDPSGFEWIETPSKFRGTGWSNALIHPPTDSYFLFDAGATAFVCVYHPGKERPVGELKVASWKHQLVICGEWLKLVKQEHDAPNLWAAITTEKALPEVAAIADNTPFSVDEQTVVSDRLREIERYILTIAHVQGEQKQFIEERFDYLESAIATQGRQAWLMTLIGLLATVVFSNNLSSSETSELFRFAGQQISDALGVAADTIRGLLGK